MKNNVLFALSFAITSGLAAQSQSHTAASAKPLRIVCATPLASQPLVVVDGVETDMQSLVLEPNSIERIDVLKDEASRVKYGEKTKGGVILITTKKGTAFYTVADFVNAEKNLNPSVKQVELNGKLLPDMNKLLIEKEALNGTMILSDAKIDEKACELVLNDTLVIKTKSSADKK